MSSIYIASGKDLYLDLDGDVRFIRSYLTETQAEQAAIHDNRELEGWKRSLDSGTKAQKAHMRYNQRKCKNDINGIFRK